MFFVRWIMKVLSLPFSVLGHVAAILQIPWCVPLLKAAWWIGGDGRLARLALARMVHHHGAEAAREKAVAWMAARPRIEIAGYAGLLALQAGELDLARDFLDRGRAAGMDRDGALEALAFLLARQINDRAAAIELARRLESRRDLPALVSRGILVDLLWDALANRRFEEAGRRARHLLEVENVPEAELALWALAKYHGDTRRADIHLARGNVPPLHRAYFEVLGNAYIGAHADAEERLQDLRAMDPSLAHQAEAILAGRDAAQ